MAKKSRGMKEVLLKWKVIFTQDGKDVQEIEKWFPHGVSQEAYILYRVYQDAQYDGYTVEKHDGYRVEYMNESKIAE